jgi:hypothetical protein
MISTAAAAFGFLCGFWAGLFHRSPQQPPEELTEPLDAIDEIDQLIRGAQYDRLGYYERQEARIQSLCDQHGYDVGSPEGDLLMDCVLAGRPYEEAICRIMDMKR